MTDRLRIFESWPSCYYDSSPLCGDPKTRQAGGGPTDYDKEIVRRGWHIMDMCDCPSCPLRVKISGLLPRENAA